MRRRAVGTLGIAASVSFSAVVLAAEPPRLLRQPTLSSTSIAFSFAGDLWVAPRSGGEARRLTASVGLETEPVFSPDGRSLAFSGEYDGNVDVFVVPAAGGEPSRLTDHPGNDRAVGWTRDGGRVVFRSNRDSGHRPERLWTVEVAGGWPARLPLEEAFSGSFSPDGRRLAVMPHDRLAPVWKRYRGGESTFLWIVDLGTLEVEAIPRENSNDSDPAWADDGRVYFLSDRDGPVTLYRYDPAPKAVDRVFGNDGLDLRNAKAGPGAIVFERFGEIGLYDLASGSVHFPPISLAPELEATRPRFAKVGSGITAAAISPTGARAAFATRGEIVTVPAEKGDPRNVTQSPGAADRDPAWSPDGKTLAWISDRSGDVALELAAADGLAPGRTLAPPSPTFLYSPRWSPDAKKVALYDVRLRLWIVDVASGRWTHVDTDLYDTPVRSLDPAWSPDSRFVAYAKREPSQLHAIHVYDLATGRSHRLTDGRADARFPVFDASGKYLWLTASTDYGPSLPWLDMTGVERPVRRALWLAVLPGGEPSPFPPESDEEAAGPKKAESDKGEKAADAPPSTTIDFEGLERRVVVVPGVIARHYEGLAAGKAGEVFLREAPELLDPDAEEPGPGPLWKYALADRKATQLAASVSAMHLSRDGEKVLFRSADGWSIAETAGPIEAGQGRLDLDAIEIRVEPRAEWRQIFHEAWRLQRDFFYDPAFHGVDLAAAEARYTPYLDGLGHRSDLTYLLEESLGELSVGHLYVGGGDRPSPAKVRGGLLGADWEVADGRYRLVRVFSGESWNAALEAPLDRPGVDAKAGEYLIAVEGRELRPPASLYGAFEGSAGRRLRIRLAADPSGAGGRDVVVVPIASERALRYRAWVEDNRRTVERLSGGRIGYVHLPDTGGAGFAAFNRDFFSQADKPALLVDERFNAGGLIADYVVEVLARKPLWGLVSRTGPDTLSPAGAHYGPKAMLINRHAGSGGDALPWMFRKLGLGPLVGTRTWGGLVGIWDYPVLIDGGSVTSPRGGLYTIDGRWEVENQGVAPDFPVEVMPQDFAAGRDPQLEKGVELLLAELAKGGPKLPVRPPFPDYQTSPWRSEAVP